MIPLGEAAIPGVPFDLGALATGGAFGALVWYLISRAMPKMVTEFRDDLKDERALRQAFATELATAMRELRDEIAEMRADLSERRKGS